jgi:glycosyltransferase involved in cell wall biosynthesis
MNVLYLSYDGMTDPLGQSQVLPYLEGLSRLGHRFTLISFEKAAAFEQDKAKISQICTAAGIDWQPLPYTKTPPIVSTIKDVRAMTKLAFKLHGERQFDLVHCRSYISALVGLKMKRQLGVKFLFDMRGFYADERVDGGLWPQNNPVFKLVYSYFKRKETQFLQEADHVISLTQTGKNEMLQWSHVKRNNLTISVIPCCADLDLFNTSAVNHAQQDSLRTKLGLSPGQFVLGYLGSVGTWYMLDEMLDCFQVLRRFKPDAVFLFVTGEAESFIRDKALAKGIPAEALVITKSPRLEVPTYLSLVDLGIFFIKPVFSKKASSPVKQGEMMGMGIPCIVNAGVGDVDEITQQYQAGYCLPALNEAAYTQAFEKLDQLLQADRQCILDGAEQFYSLKAGIARYNQVYEAL